MIDLFEHNRIAYESAIAMLEKKTGKAAIVHPTGTGKSFIGFKLCEDNSDKIICWLSPSEYIFKTQLENLKPASDGYEPENISFFTYAKLTNLTEAEILEIKPDFIILDEFHRCGAEFWGQGVQNLLNQYPEVPILGLFISKGFREIKKRVYNAQSRIVRDAAERYLEALRRALEKADGLDVIFDQHIEDRTGKYIVFCANKEHMYEMISPTKEYMWTM